MHISSDLNEAIRQVQKLATKRAPLNIDAVRRHSPALLRAAYALIPFVGWRALLEMAGLNYERINIELESTVECRICGKSYGMLVRHVPKIHEVSCEEYLKEFPGAGLISEAVIYQRRSSRPRKLVDHPHWEPLWSQEYVLDRLNYFRGLGFDLNYKAFREIDSSPTNEATKFFGSWDAALLAIGQDPKCHRKAAPALLIDKQMTKKMLQERRLAGRPLNDAALHRENRHLYAAALKHFGNFSNALRAIKVDPIAVRQCVRYDDSDIAAILVEAKTMTQDFGPSRVKKFQELDRHYQLIRRRYGSWEQFAREHCLREAAFSRRCIYADCRSE